MFYLPTFNFCNPLKDFEKDQGQFVSSLDAYTDTKSVDDFLKTPTQLSEVSWDFDSDDAASPSLIRDQDAVFCPVSPKLVGSDPAKRKRFSEIQGW